MSKRTDQHEPSEKKAASRKDGLLASPSLRKERNGLTDAGKDIQTEKMDGTFLESHSEQQESIIELGETDESRSPSFSFPSSRNMYSHNSSDEFPWNIGDVVDEKYEVREIIGRGGMGIVYKVRHREWNIDLAVKMPLSGMLTNELVKARFIREAQTWVDLRLHPNIVQCWYVRELDGVPCVFMDYLDGGSLRDWIRQGIVKPGEWEKILDIIIQACDGLGYAHDHGVEAHRDVKPGNFLMSTQGEVRVTDFGIVKYKGIPDFDYDDFNVTFSQRFHEAATLTITGTDLGTPEYSAPEQWGQAKHADARSDIYALGGIFFELCCGRRAFDDKFQRVPPETLIGRHLFAPIPDIRTINHTVPDPIAELIIQCLAKEPEQRPGTMAELRERLVWVYQEVVGKTYWRKIPQAAELRSDALNNRAVSLLDLSSKEEALSTFQEALQLDAHHPESLYNMSLLEWRDDTISDVEVVRRLREAKQTSWRAGLYLGFIHLERAAADQAEQEFLEALRHNPPSESGLIWRALGDARMAQEHFFEAETAYQKALKYMPGDFASRQRLLLAKHRTRCQAGTLLFPYPRCLQTFTGYHKELTCAALSPSGRFAFVGNDYEVQLWDLALGKFFWRLTRSAHQNFWTFQGFANSDTSVSITQDGAFAVSGGSSDPTLKLWDMSTGECLRILKGHSQGITAIALTQDGQYAVSGSLDKTLRLWELATGKCVRLFKGHKKSILAVAVSPDGHVILSGAGRTIRVWDLSTGKYIKRFRGHKGLITALTMTHDGRFVVSGSRDNTLRLWIFTSGKHVQTFEGHRGRITDIALTPDDSLIVSGSADHTLRLWDAETGECLRTFTGHAHTVTSLVLTPDGHFALSISRDQTLRIWELATGQCLHTFKEFTYWLEGLAITPDGHKVLVGNHEDLQLQDFSNGTCLKKLTVYRDDGQRITWKFVSQTSQEDRTPLHLLPPGEVFLTIKGGKERTPAIRVTSDGQVALSGGTSTTLHLWDVETSSILWSFRSSSGLQIFRKNKNWLGTVAISQDEQLLLSGWYDSSVRLWMLKTGKILRILEGHTETIATVAMTVDGRFGVSGSFDHTLRLWDLSTGHCVHVFKGHEATVTTAAITPDGRYLLSGSMDTTVRLWDCTTGKCLRTFTGHQDTVTLVAISANGQFALSRSLDKTFRLWQLDAAEQHPPSNMQVCRQQEHQEAQNFRKRFLKYLNRSEMAMNTGKVATAYTFLALARTVPGYERDPKVIALNATLASVLQRKTLRAGRLLSTFDKHHDAINAVAITPDGKFAISGGRDNEIRLWSLTTQKCLRVLQGHRNNVSCVAVTANRHIVFSGSWDTSVRLWASATGECLNVFDEHEDYVRTLAITPDARFLVSGSSDRTIRLWEFPTNHPQQGRKALRDVYKTMKLASKRSLRVLKGHTTDVTAIAISADGQFAVSGGQDQTLRLWSLSTGKCLKVLEGHEHYVSAISITANGRFAISGSRDTTLRLWNLSRGRCLRVFEGHTDYVNALDLTSDGRFILSGSRDKTLRLWHLTTGECLQVFDRHERSVEAVSMTPDGRFAISGGYDNTVRLWEFDWKLAPTKNHV